MSHPKPEVNDALAVEGHWLGGQFRVNSGAISIPFPAGISLPVIFLKSS